MALCDYLLLAIAVLGLLRSWWERREGLPVVDKVIEAFADSDY